MKSGFFPLLIVLLFLSSFLFTSKAFAFEATSTTFEIHSGSLNSISGSSSGSNFVLQGNGGGSAFGNITQGIFKIFSGIVNWFFGIFTARYEETSFRWRNDDGGEADSTSGNTLFYSPNAAGFATAFTINAGCTAGNNWNCVRDSGTDTSSTAPTNDGATSGLQSLAGTDYYALVNDAIPTGSIITRLDISAWVSDTGNPNTSITLGYCTSCTGASNVMGTPQAVAVASYTEYPQSFTGLSLSTTDLNNMQLVVTADGIRAAISTVYVKITYTTPATAIFPTAENVTLGNLAKNTPVRLRFAVANNGWSRDTDVSPQFRIEYAETATCSSGTYTAVPVTPTSEHWQMVDSVYLADGGATTNVTSGLTDSNSSFSAGQVKDTSNMTGLIPIHSNDFTEIEYSIQATNNATASGNYCFRVTDNGSATKFVYTQYPTVTISGGGTPNQTQYHFRWFNDDGVEGYATPTNNTDATLSGAYVGDRKRLRVLVQNAGTAAATDITYKLEVASTTCTAWYPVPNSATTEHWSMDLSGYVGNSTPTIDSAWIANPSGTFTPGYIMTSSNTTGPITLSTTQFTELEYSIKSTVNVNTGTTYCFRLTNAGATTNFTYTTQPQAVVLPQNYKPSGGGGSTGGGEGIGSGAVQGGGTPTGGGASPGDGSGAGTPIGGGGSGGGGSSE